MNLNTIPYLKRFVILFVFALLPLFGTAQSWQLPFAGKVEEFDEKKQKDVALEGAQVTLYKGGSVQNQASTPSNGKFKFSLDPNTDYVITITRNGYIMKKFAINTTNVSEERGNAGFGGMDIIVVLFKTYPGLDYSCLDKPIAKISYNSAKDVEDFDYDRAYTASIQACIEKLKELERQARLREKMYNDAIVKADKAFAAKQYEAARAGYNEALGVKPDEQYPKDQIKEIERLLAELNKGQKAEQDYQAAMARGNTALGSKNYDAATTAYNEALALKPNDAAATAKIKEVNDAKNNAAAAAEKEAKYADAMKRGNDALAAKSYEPAIAAYKEALGFKPNDATANAKIKEAQDALNAAKSAAEKEAKYADAMKRGNDAMSAKTYEAALTAFNEALGIKPGDATATAKAKEAQDAINANKAAAEKEAKYADAMKRGNTAMTAKTYEGALAAFNEALTFKPGDATATAKAKEAQDAINAAKSAAEKDAKYADAMKRGNDAMTAKTYEGALAAFKEAISFKPADAAATAKAKEAQDAIDAARKAGELDKQYADAMKQGSTALGSKQYDAAKKAYTTASGLKPNEQEPKDKLKEIDAILAGLAADKEKEANYQAAMTKANGLFAEKKYEAAKSAYNEALGLKANDVPATAGVKKCDDAMAALAKSQEAQKQYDAAMAAGQTAQDGKRYEDALAKYQEALQYKPNDAPATAKVKEVQALLNASKAYADAMQKANGLFGETKYAEAKAAYNDALKAKPGDVPATDGVKKCDEQLDIIRKSGELEKQYADAMKQGAAALSAKQYDAAKKAYTNANGLKPNEQEPKDKLKEIDAILAGLAADKEKEANYQAAMTKANGLFTDKKYEAAKTAYNEALGIKTNDAPATAGVKKCDDAMAAMAKSQEAQKMYDAAMAAGQTAQDGKKYDDALAKYQEALQYKPADAPATAKVKEVQAIINASKAYTDAMAKGNSLFGETKYAEARAQFQAALKAKAGDDLATEGVKKCDEQLDLIRKSGELEKQYADAMKKGAAAMSAKQYEAAKAAYTTANGLKPDEQEPKTKLAEIEALLNGIAANKEKEAAYQAAMTKANGLFAEKKYEAAKTAYNDALGIKANDAPATAGVKKCEDAMAALAKSSEAQKNYDEAMAAGKVAQEGNNFEEALAKYQQALQYKPADAPATAKVKEVQSILNAGKAYSDAMKAADALFAQTKYAEAKAQYQAALKARAGDEAATQGVIKCDDELNKVKYQADMEKRYSDAMKQGAAAFAAKKYTEAKTAYTTATGLKPAEEEPKAKLREIDELLGKMAGDAEKERIYNEHMTKANGLFNEKKYEQAKAEYNEALGVKPADAVATAGVKKCDDAISKMGMDEKYKAIIAEADQSFTVKQFAAAKTKYNEALAVKPGDAYAKQRIAECDKELGLAEKDKVYVSALKSADSLLAVATDEPSYLAAKAAYKTASTMKPTDQYPKDKMTDIDRKINDLKADKARRTKYDAIIVKADGLLAKKDYKSAKTTYQEALTLYPMELYPKQKIAECDKALNPSTTAATNTVTQTREEIVNDLVKKYPQGVTEISENEPTCKVTKRVVVKGNEAWVYTRKVFSWGGVYYFKDGVQISENTFNQETK